MRTDIFIHRTQDAKYSVEPAQEYGPGGGVNGTGKRKLVKGFFVVERGGRRVRAFEENNRRTLEQARVEATKWAEYLNENMP